MPHAPAGQFGASLRERRVAREEHHRPPLAPRDVAFDHPHHRGVVGRAARRIGEPIDEHEPRLPRIVIGAAEPAGQRGRRHAQPGAEEGEAVGIGRRLAVE